MKPSRKQKPDERNRIMDNNVNEIKCPDLTGASSLEVAKEMVKILDLKKARELKLLHVEE